MSTSCCHFSSQLLRDVIHWHPGRKKNNPTTLLWMPQTWRPPSCVICKGLQFPVGPRVEISPVILGSAWCPLMSGWMTTVCHAALKVIIIKNTKQRATKQSEELEATDNNTHKRCARLEPSFIMTNARFPDTDVMCSTRGPGSAVHYQSTGFTAYWWISPGRCAPSPLHVR